MKPETLRNLLMIAAQAHRAAQVLQTKPGIDAETIRDLRAKAEFLLNLYEQLNTGERQ